MYPNLPLHEAFSGITGSISLASWIFVLLPQLYENYKLGSADGISFSFLVVWFIGDLANLIGSIWAKLVPTVIALAVYFCFADAVLIAQCLYYSYAAPSKGDASEAVENDPSQPLLQRKRTGSSTGGNIGLPGSRRKSSSTAEQRTALLSPGMPTIVEEPSSLRIWGTNITAVLAVCLLGTLGWFAAWKMGVWQPSFEEGVPDEEGQPIGAEVLGYFSAVAYLGARIPQIMKNYREKSCEGLSLLFFMLSMLGNLTYGASILLHSIDSAYVIKNVPWLIGSLGTIAEDLMIFVQFRLYSKREDNSALLE